MKIIIQKSKGKIKMNMNKKGQESMIGGMSKWILLLIVMVVIIIILGIIFGLIDDKVDLISAVGF